MSGEHRCKKGQPHGIAPTRLLMIGVSEKTAWAKVHPTFFGNAGDLKFGWSLSGWQSEWGDYGVLAGEGVSGACDLNAYM